CARKGDGYDFDYW
nr:immunoglobulin heavy chain junction region [Mus musculus]